MVRAVQEKLRRCYLLKRGDGVELTKRDVHLE
jgi:hypothetical protein